METETQTQPKVILTITTEIREDGSVYTAPFNLTVGHTPTLVDHFLHYAKNLHATFAKQVAPLLTKESTDA